MNTTQIVTFSADPSAPALLPLREFLRTHSISKSQFYREAAKGNAPAVVKNGRRTLVPVAAAAAWLAARIQPAAALCRPARAARAAQAQTQR
jgi:predicted DNA-binding transcriptional regulator AlpA